MDYRTFVFTNIASMTVFTLCVSALAWHNRSVTGMRWFAGGLIVAWPNWYCRASKAKSPQFWATWFQTNFYLISSLLQLIGLHWFIIRKPFRHRWSFVILGLALAIYTWTFLGKIPYSGNVINLPNVAVCAAASWMLFNTDVPQFRA